MSCLCTHCREPDSRGCCTGQSIRSDHDCVCGTIREHYCPSVSHIRTVQPSEPSALTLSGAPVATQLSGPATDRRQSLRDMNESLRQSVAESTSRLSTANALLRTARQDEQLAAVAFETHDSIMITDKDGKILRVNRSFTELTSYASEDVVGNSPRVLKSGRHGEEFYHEMWQPI